MSKEDKIARNIVVITWLLLMTVMLLLTSSCSTTYSCAAYASVEQTKK